MMATSCEDPPIYWNKKIANTGLERFQKIIEKKYKLKFKSYWELHKWTTDNYVSFWEEMWHFFEVIHSEPYREVFVKTGPGFLDNQWFVGAKLNYAENILRIRDDRVALICLDERGNEDTVTYAELFEEVKIYASAFRKNGLKIGDTVACYMSNRKEAVFAFLAVASIGGLWGGAIPFYGAKVASNTISKMNPKFLISIDIHYGNGQKYPNVDYLAEIVSNTPTIEKVILVITHEETHQKDLSTIPSCLPLEEFLDEGRTLDGKVPDIDFEQLPFDQPLVLNFTSGTIASPKAAIHSHGTIISNMRDYAISYDMRSGDIVCTSTPVGWSSWDDFIPCLALGLPLFLYCGSVCYTINNCNIWDLLAKYKVKLIALTPTIVDVLEKMQVVPSDKTDIECLEKVILTAIPMKKENVEYLQSKVRKNLFVGNIYGATEVFGNFSGFNINMPIYGTEIQVPSLGIDIQCYDSEGNSVIGQKGKLVICKPAINFLIGLWNDKSQHEVTDIYLKEFPGVWTQHDECWINPKTKGIIIIGRSDDILKQNGVRFSATDVYSAIHSLDEIQDYICVPQRNFNGDCRAVLFVEMRNGRRLSPQTRTKIKKAIETELLVLCVPDLILEVPAIPYNFNNKRMESLVQKIVNSNKIPGVMNIRNPESLKYFLDVPEVVSYTKN